MSERAADAGAPGPPLRVAITGCAALSPLGASLAAMLAQLAAGDSMPGRGGRERGGLAAGSGSCAAGDRSGLLPPTEVPSPAARWPRLHVPGFDARAYFPSAKVLKLTDRRAELAVASALAALTTAGHVAGLAPPPAAGSTRPPGGLDHEELAVVLGTSVGNLRVPALVAALAGDAETTEPGAPFAARVLGGLHPLWLLQALPNMAAAHVAIRLGARGASDTRMTGSLAGVEAMLDAARMVADGEAPWALAGATEDAGLPELVLGAIQREGEVPAPADPAGGGDAGLAAATAGALGFGEGAVVLVLEPLAQARRRGATVRGCVCGGALRVVAAERELADAVAAAITAALAEAGWETGEVGCGVAVAEWPIEEGALIAAAKQRLPGASWSAGPLAPGTASAAGADRGEASGTGRPDPRVGQLRAVAAPLALALLLAAWDEGAAEAAEPELTNVRSRRLLVLAADPVGLVAALAVELGGGAGGGDPSCGQLEHAPAAWPPEDDGARKLDASRRHPGDVTRRRRDGA